MGVAEQVDEGRTFRKSVGDLVGVSALGLPGDGAREPSLQRRQLPRQFADGAGVLVGSVARDLGVIELVQPSAQRRDPIEQGAGLRTSRSQAEGGRFGGQSFPEEESAVGVTILIGATGRKAEDQPE
jgi:hypothetical protein